VADKIAKLLAKLSRPELLSVKNITSKITKGDTKGLDIKKLKGETDIYRVRKGQLRIIFQKRANQEVELLQISRRSEKTYKNF
jgi:mRNA-degrading endonuclease RelE of RelBE toxin-antitoxin system